LKKLKKNVFFKDKRRSLSGLGICSLALWLFFTYGKEKKIVTLFLCSLPKSKSRVGHLLFGSLLFGVLAIFRLWQREKDCIALPLLFAKEQNMIKRAKSASKSLFKEQFAQKKNLKNNQVSLIVQKVRVIRSFLHKNLQFASTKTD
jgi:hypothetical protein